MTRTETALAPMIRNAEATLVEYQTEAASVPVIVPDPKPAFPSKERCWTTCLESAVVGYVMDEWRERAQPKGLKTMAGNLAATISSGGPWRRAVQVGSLPFSTTMRSEAGARLMWELLPELRQAMPARPFAIRNLLASELPDTLPADAVKIPARLVYLQDFRDGTPPAGSCWRRDLIKLRGSGLIGIGDSEFDTQRMEEGLELYRQVYRTKYSRRHPDFTPEFLLFARQRGWIRLTGLIDPASGKLVTFCAEHCSPTTLSVPFLGHDTSQPKSKALYRQACARITLDAIERRMLENSSSGCGEFKRNRQFHPAIEYLVVMPALEGARRLSDRAVLGLAEAATRKIGLEDMLAAGG